MKNVRYFLVLIVAALILASCGSMPGGGAVSGVLGAIGSGRGASSGGGAIAAASATVDFQKGEVLTSSDSGPMAEASYYAAKVLQAASAETKNQAQAVLISDGKKYWVNYVLNSRKASKADFTIGASVLVLRGWQDHDEISVDAYRKDAWVIGNVTSVEELFKNRVEVDGMPFAVKYVRVPTDPLK